MSKEVLSGIPVPKAERRGVINGALAVLRDQGSQTRRGRVISREGVAGLSDIAENVTVRSREGRLFGRFGPRLTNEVSVQAVAQSPGDPASTGADRYPSTVVHRFQARRRLIPGMGWTATRESAGDASPFEPDRPVSGFKKIIDVFTTSSGRQATPRTV